MTKEDQRWGNRWAAADIGIETGWLLHGKGDRMIRVDDISKTIKGQTILNHVSLELEDGMIYGFVGRNGSGKTVLLKAICGFITPDEGSVWVDGKKLGEDMDFLPDMGIIIEKPAFIPYLSGLENLRSLAMIRKKITEEKVREEMIFFGLDPQSKKKVKNYSVGMKQRLALAQAFMEDPAVLVLDECINGLDKEGVEVAKKRILQAKEEGKMVLLCSHIAGDLQELCDKIFEIHNGKLSK